MIHTIALSVSFPVFGSNYYDQQPVSHKAQSLVFNEDPRALRRHQHATGKGHGHGQVHGPGHGHSHESGQHHHHHDDKGHGHE